MAVWTSFHASPSLSGRRISSESGKTPVSSGRSIFPRSHGDGPRALPDAATWRSSGFSGEAALRSTSSSSHGARVALALTEPGDDSKFLYSKFW